MTSDVMRKILAAGQAIEVLSRVQARKASQSSQEVHGKGYKSEANEADRTQVIATPNQDKASS